MWKALNVLLALLIAPVSLVAQSAQTPSKAESQEVQTMSFCDLAKDPAGYNHKLIRITAFVTRGFEDFHLAEPDCPALGYEFSVWLKYGGKAESGAVYCCPGEGDKGTRPKMLSVDGIEIPLVQDAVFKQFDELLSRESDTTVHATLVGRFFSGTKQNYGGPTFWGGAGHLGCCSLFVIQQVEAFDPHSRTDVDYTAEAGWYEGEESRCEVGSVRYWRHVSVNYEPKEAKEALAEQEQADAGMRPWAFTDPERVATDSLKPYFKDQVPVLERVKATPVRVVFRWAIPKRVVFVTVLRPYWLSFYSKTGSVAWVSATIRATECK